MFSLSYLCHGIFLNDLQRLSYPKEIFLIGSIITYLILGFLLSNIYQMKFPAPIAKKPIVRGLISGFLLGIATYIVAMVVGVSFDNEVKIQYVLFGLCWQAIEQTFGGITVGFIYIWIYDGNPAEVITRKLMGD